MKFSKPGSSLTHTTDSFKKNWKLALHDPLFLFVAFLVLCIGGIEIYARYFL